MTDGLTCAVKMFCVVGLATFLGAQVRSATAQGGENAATYRAPPVKPGPARNAATASSSAGYSLEYSPARPYFVEFRARNAESYGHMYVMYGEANSRHEIIKSEIAGFFPAGDRQDCLNCSATYWTIGHVLPVPSEIGASDGDLEEQYVLARFRIWVDAAQYQRLVAYINERKAHKGPWNAFFANCVTFGRDVGSFLNLKMPVMLSVAPTIVMYPKDVVVAMREANGIHQDQGPLKDAPGSLPIQFPKPAPKAKPAAAATTTAPAAVNPNHKKLANRRIDEGAASNTVH